MLLFCYEAGPPDYGPYHQSLGSGHACQVVAPSRTPKPAGDRIKTGRRGANKLVII
jgi:hypothetical protein